MSRGPVRAGRSLRAFVIAVICLSPAIARAQAPSAVPAAQVSTASKLWLVVGGLSTTFLGDCTDCEGATYGHTGSVVTNVGWSLNPRTDLGAELLWVASKSTSADRIRVTFVMSALQFRPWQNRGFFLKTGAGMAFVHNWIFTDDGEDSNFRSKAFALAIGAGWEWTVSRRFGVQVLGTQHVATLGDLQTSTRTMENVVGNFWLAGAAVVIR